MHDTYTLKHDLDRPGQLQALLDIHAATTPYVIVDGATGSGKSAWVAATSVLSQYIAGARDLKTLVITHSINQQKSNYLDSYDFDYILGKRNYDCGQHAGANAENCPEDGCKNTTCPYRRAYIQAIESPRLSVNVAKYFADPYLIESFAADIVFIDEAHLISDVTIEYSGGTFDWKSAFWEIPPVIFSGINQRAQAAGQQVLSALREQLISNEPDKTCADPVTGTKVKSPEWLRWNRLAQKFNRVVTANSSDLYYEGTKEQFIIKPLTARNRFHYIFGEPRHHAPKVVLMTATPGNPEILAAELGITGKYTFIQVEDQYSSEARAVEILSSPRLHYKSPERDYETQADVIANKIKADFIHDTGVLLVTSKAAAQQLAMRLGRRGINVFIPTPGAGTDKNYNEWLAARSTGRYHCMVAWSLWEAVDLGMDKYLFICKVPWGFLGDKYSESRKNYDSNLYCMATANQIEQGAGRLRRLDEHFIIGAKYIAIVDNGVFGLMDYFSPRFKAALRQAQKKVQVRRLFGSA